MDVFKVTPCSRKPGRYDVTVNGSYPTFTDKVRDTEHVEVLSRTPYLTMIEYEGERYAVEKDRDVDNRFTVTLSADTEDEAVNRLQDLAAAGNVNLKE